MACFVQLNSATATFLATVDIDLLRVLSLSSLLTVSLMSKDDSWIKEANSFLSYFVVILSSRLTIGNPDAIASWSESGNPSLLDGSTKTSHAW